MNGQTAKQAVILAGGYGTRLYPLTQTRAKSLLPVVGVPLIHRIVRYLEKNGFNQIIVTLNNFSDQIKESFREFDTPAEIIFSEESVPLGTAGSVKNAKKHISGTFLVMQGDSLTNIDLAGAEKFHFEQKAMATILLQERKEVKGFGVVDIDGESNVSRFVEKPSISGGGPRLISTGLYLLDAKTLDYIPEEKPYDFAKDLFPSLLRMGAKLKGVPVEGYWIDIGTPNAYREANQSFLKRLTEQLPVTNAARLGQAISSEALVDKVSFGKGLGSWFLVGTSLVREKSSIDKKAIIENSVIEKGVSVASGAVLRDSVILEGSVVEAGATAESAIVGEGRQLGRGSGVGYGAVVGGYVRIEPSARVSENSIVPPKSVVEPLSPQWVAVC